MHVEFFGAAGEVTGSCHLVTVGDHRILLDCGMIQGGREEHRRNGAPFAFDTRKIDAMVLSHAHIDHVGRLPLLSKRGYRGPIYTHPATAELSRVMLIDSARLAGADTERENRRRARSGLKPLQPLYDEEDVERVLRQLRPVDYDQRFELLPRVFARLSDAGHIIGAAIVELWGGNGSEERKLVFSADIGPRGAPILRDPTVIEEADLVMLESTYGDRLHRSREETVAELGRVFAKAHADGGNVLIPAFAVGRSQEILYWMSEHYQAWGLERWKISFDSPMGEKVTGIYHRFRDLFDEEAKAAFAKDHNPFKMPNLELISDPAASQKLNELRHGQIIIAGSGMCNGGRIVHHLRHHLWRESTHVVFAGYQAGGTLGRQIVDGAKTVRIYGESIRVAAQRHTVGGLSAHADQAGLVEWYGHFKKRPPVWLVHGEDPAREVLADKLRHEFGASVSLARPGASATV